MSASTLYVCENQPVLVEGLRQVIAACDDLEITGVESDLTSAITDPAAGSTALFLLGQPFTAKSILPLVAQYRDAGFPSKLVLWVGELSDVDAFRAMQMGARGIVSKTKPVPVLVECLRTVARGSIWSESPDHGSNGGLRANGAIRITPREREIVEFVCRGLKNKEIAQELSITPGTVKVHLMHIFEKTGVKDRFQLAIQGRQMFETAREAAVIAAASSGD